MKKMILLFVCLVGVFSIHAQDIQQLETKPSFKGITIGMPISEISSKLSFEKSSNGYSIYMNYVRVIGLNGKVHAIEAMKQVSATREHATVFDATELDIIQAGLTRLYGEPKYALNDSNSQYNRIGVQWITKSKQANCFIDFYGTLVGYKLQFSLCEHHEDF